MNKKKANYIENLLMTRRSFWINNIKHFSEMSTDDYDKLRSKHYINPLSGHPGIYSNREFYKWCKYIEDTYGIIFNMNGYLKRNIFTIRVIITGIEINPYHEDKITPEVIDEFDKLAETANNVNYRFYIAKW